jgi:membrane protein CcdC involved in cytochrome C biogenesis
MSVALPTLHVFGLGAALGGAAVMLAWRVRETTRAVTERSIVVPPLAMSTGFAMFAAPSARVPLAWAAAAFLAGALVLAVPLARSSTLVRRGDEVVLRRSPAFLAVLLGLLAVRLALRGWIEDVVSPVQTGALLFVLAFGMILRWRVGMLVAYRRLTRA